MATIKRFEGIKAWQVARELTKLVYDITRTGAFAKYFGLKEQIRRAAVSIGSNIAEGFARNGKKEFAKFRRIAKGSAAEVQSQIYTALDVGYISQEQFQNIYDRADSCAILIYRFITTLRSSPVAGERYKHPNSQAFKLPNI